MVTKQEIGQRVRTARRRQDLTQRQLAGLCHIPCQIINRLERGHQSVYAERLAVIAEALCVSSDFLLGLPGHGTQGLC
jgi:transcriptional regulator with XRE-family HTH domain